LPARRGKFHAKKKIKLYAACRLADARILFKYYSFRCVTVARSTSPGLRLATSSGPRPFAVTARTVCEYSLERR